MSFRRPLAALAAIFILLAACGGPAPSDGSSPRASTGAASPSVAATRPSDAAFRPPICPDRPAVTPVTPTAWWSDRVFYEVFVRSFADSDGDGIGDLAGLTARLDELNDGDPTTTHDLGVSALWLMPVAASPSYHGYDVTDYLMVEPDYGTNEDFRALVAAAETRGIEIVVDLVINHTSVEHPWFQEARQRGSAREDWYRWADEHPVFGGPSGRPVWHADGDRWYYGYFWEGMPDLNIANPEVTTELDRIATFWLDEMGAAGFRLDAARHLIEDGSTLENTPATFTWLKGFRERTHATDPDALVLGEVWDATSVAASYVREGALDLTFDFGLASQMLSAVRFGDPVSLSIVQAEVSSAYPTGGYAAFLTNHDQDRAFDVLGRDVAAAKQAATLLLTNPGVPFIYYGEEVGLRGRKPDEKIRTPMPWTGDGPGYGFTTGEPWEPMAEDVATTNVAAQTADPASLLSHYRTLIALRTAHPALGVRGSQTPVEASVKGVYAVLRNDPVGGESILIVSNLTDKVVTDVRVSLAEGPLCDTPGAEPLLGTAPGFSPPNGTAAGGLDDWLVGDLAPHEDLIVKLTP
ncbi:MAG: alpha-amylase family glycosyl hydrolase [Candidatus Limnocylindrales bacterium]